MLPSKFLRRMFLVAICLSSVSLQANVLDEVLERGSLRVGVAEFVPWTLKDKKGELMGFEVDVARKLARDMGVTPEFKVYVWEDIIPALQKGEIDVIAGGMAITPARALQVNFSRPLAESGIGIATNTSMTADVTSLAQLDDPEIIITTVKETFAAGTAEVLFGKADVRALSERDAAEKEVLEGRAHAYLAHMPEVKFLVLKNPEIVDLPMSEPLVGNSEALAVRKGEQEFLNFLNAWVTARQSDKWIKSTRDYWFSTLEWTEDAAR